jgi:hypothetical protein
MKAGKELDRLVAEKVMGDMFANDPDTHGANGYPPNYSTNIADAWLVIEKVISNNEFVYVNLSFDSVAWICEFCGDTTVGASGTLDNPSAPYAICLAALSAVGIYV